MYTSDIETFGTGIFNCVFLFCHCRWVGACPGASSRLKLERLPPVPAPRRTLPTKVESGHNFFKSKRHASAAKNDCRETPCRLRRPFSQMETSSNGSYKNQLSNHPRTRNN